MRDMQVLKAAIKAEYEKLKLQPITISLITYASVIIGFTTLSLGQAVYFVFLLVVIIVMSIALFQAQRYKRRLEVIKHQFRIGRELVPNLMMYSLTRDEIPLNNSLNISKANLTYTIDEDITTNKRSSFCLSFKYDCNSLKAGIDSCSFPLIHGAKEKAGNIVGSVKCNGASVQAQYSIKNQTTTIVTIPFMKKTEKGSNIGLEWQYNWENGHNWGLDFQTWIIDPYKYFNVLDSVIIIESKNPKLYDCMITVCEMDCYDITWTSIYAKKISEKDEDGYIRHIIPLKTPPTNHFYFVIIGNNNGLQTKGY